MNQMSPVQHIFVNEAATCDGLQSELRFIATGDQAAPVNAPDECGGAKVEAA